MYLFLMTVIVFDIIIMMINIIVDALILAESKLRAMRDFILLLFFSLTVFQKFFWGKWLTLISDCHKG